MITDEHNLEKEMKLYTKKSGTLAILEEALAACNTSVQNADIQCPFGNESLEVQELVTHFKVELLSLSKVLNKTRNAINNNYSDNVQEYHERVVSTEKDVVSDMEDHFAIMKSNVTNELELSRKIREYDYIAQENLDKRLKELEEGFKDILTSHPNIKNSKENSFYSIIE